VHSLFDDLDPMARQVAAQLRLVVCAEREAEMIEIAPFGNRRDCPRRPRVAEGDPVRVLVTAAGTVLTE
jgi:hypothetical protein